MQKNSFERIQTTYFNLEHRKQTSMNLTQDNEQWLQKIDEFNHQFTNVMDDDFNTANAISVLFDVTKTANLYLEEAQTSSEVLESFQTTIETILHVLGISLEKETDLLDEDIEALIVERNEARKNRNFERADEIRDLLKDKNIILEDTPQGVRWKRG